MHPLAQLPITYPTQLILSSCTASFPIADLSQLHMHPWEPLPYSPCHYSACNKSLWMEKTRLQFAVLLLPLKSEHHFYYST